MIIPSIDIMGGQVVQLVGGKKKVLEAGEPSLILADFGIVGEVAVIDLDAAMSQGSNDGKIKTLIRQSPCRVGGGIRDLEAAVKWLDLGASKIILGTKAIPEILSQLPKERVIAAVDAFDGDVVVEGWQTKTGVSILEKINELKNYVGGFLVTFVEKEGKLGGTNLDQVAAIVKAAGKAKVTIAGGISTTREIAELDRLGADAQVGMAIYTNKISLSEAFLAPCIFKDGGNNLIPTVVCDEAGLALGFVWSNQESIAEAIKTKCGVYYSRKRGLWKKGESSGNTQELIKIDLDCDRDCLRFIVRQKGAGFCHLETSSCWGEAWGMTALDRQITLRKENAPKGSYTKRLFSDAELLDKKIKEETLELIEAKTKEEVTFEAADLFYFSLVKAHAYGIGLNDIARELNKRSLKVTRREGGAKV